MEQLDHSTTKVSDEYDGRMRKLFLKNCSICDSPFWVPGHVPKKFCSTECCHESQKRRVWLNCAVCGDRFERTEGKSNDPKGEFRFCGRICKDRAQILEVGLINYSHYKDGEREYRKRALRHYGKKCSNPDCGYEKHEEMLDVHHVDGDRNNSQMSNLAVLCVWCHALKTRRVEPHARA